MKTIQKIARMSAYAIAFGALALTGFNVQAMNKKPTKAEVDTMLKQCQWVDEMKTAMFTNTNYALPFHMICMPVLKAVRGLKKEQVAAAVHFGKLFDTEIAAEQAIMLNDKDVLQRAVTERAALEAQIPRELKDLVRTDHRILDNYVESKKYCETISTDAAAMKAAKHGREFASACVPFFAQFKDSLKAIENDKSYKGLPLFQEAMTNQSNDFNIVTTLGIITKKELEIKEAKKKGHTEAAQIITQVKNRLVETLDQFKSQSN
jgi:hypothetical protein